VDLLADAFLQVAASFPNARLLFIGHGEEESRLRHLLAKEVASTAVRIIPGASSADLPHWYRAMDVFVLPSRYENFSNALLEAAACGVPFIASNVGGNRTLQQGEAGVLFECGSSRDLGHRLRSFLENAHVYRRPALAFSADVRKRYSWAASADRLEWILQSHLNIRPGQETVRQRGSDKRLRSTM
jgi:glycosyltransferase involved in cell wall biosynthesis